MEDKHGSAQCTERHTLTNELFLEGAINQHANHFGLYTNPIRTTI